MNARWKINILIFFSEDVDEAASDDENGQSYDKYYRMIKQEMDHLDNDVIPGDWTIVNKYNVRIQKCYYNVCPLACVQAKRCKRE